MKTWSILNHELANRPMTLFICLHFWRKEWWTHKQCHKCDMWIIALLLGAAAAKARSEDGRIW
jgi:hypothetical protein